MGEESHGWTERHRLVLDRAVNRPSSEHPQVRMGRSPVTGTEVVPRQHGRVFIAQAVRRPRPSYCVHHGVSASIVGATILKQEIHCSGWAQDFWSPGRPTHRTDVTMKLFLVMACSERGPFTFGVVESLRQGVCGSRLGWLARRPGSCGTEGAREPSRAPARSVSRPRPRRKSREEGGP